MESYKKHRGQSRCRHSVRAVRSKVNSKTTILWAEAVTEGFHTDDHMPPDLRESIFGRFSSAAPTKAMSDNVVAFIKRDYIEPENGYFVHNVEGGKRETGTSHQ